MKVRPASGSSTCRTRNGGADETGEDVARTLRCGYWVRRRPRRHPARSVGLPGFCRGNARARRRQPPPPRLRPAGTRHPARDRHLRRPRQHRRPSRRRAGGVPHVLRPVCLRPDPGRQANPLSGLVRLDPRPDQARSERDGAPAGRPPRLGLRRRQERHRRRDGGPQGHDGLLRQRARHAPGNERGVARGDRPQHAGPAGTSVPPRATRTTWVT